MTKKPLIILAGVALALTTTAPSSQAMTACQSACNTQHYNTVNSLWQTPPPSSTSMTSYREQVLAALNTLNTCLAACSAEAVNLAQGKSATASLSQSGYAASSAVDGNTSTFWWAKSTSTHYLQVDLGASTSIAKVGIHWNAYYATSYAVQTSTDAKTWTTVFSTTTGKGGALEHSFTARSVRYVRINCTKASGSNGYGINELRVFAP